MEENFGPDFITVTDENGNDFELELVDTLEHRGITYYAMFPAVEEAEEKPAEKTAQTTKAAPAKKTAAKKTTAASAKKTTKAAAAKKTAAKKPAAQKAEPPEEG